MDMGSPHDSAVTDVSLWAILGGMCIYFFKRWVAKLNPFILLRLAALWVNEPVMKKHVAPIIEEQRRQGEEQKRQGSKLDRVCRVIDNIPGAEKAKEAVAQEDKQRAQWDGLRTTPARV